MRDPLPRTAPAGYPASSSSKSWRPPRPPPARARQGEDELVLSDEEWARRLQEQFDREVAEKEAKERFTCPLCFDVARLDESVELDCLHRFCRECFTRFLEVKIQEKRVTDEELACPLPGCACEVTVPQVEGATRGTPLWERFLNSRAELWRPSQKEAELLCECPAPRCQGVRFLAPRGSSQVECPTCRMRFCPDCRAQHSGLTCKAFAAAQLHRQEEDPAEKEFRELIRKECWQRCPCCSAVCDRQHGCNFMTCYSERCRGKKFFCYLCGVELTSGQHFSHFPLGLFENACEKVDRRGEEALPKATWGTPEWWAAIGGEVWRWAGGKGGGGGEQ